MTNITEDQRDLFAINFADWVTSLIPSEKVSVWSENGECAGLFTMNNKQLLDKYKQSLQTEIKVQFCDCERILGSSQKQDGNWYCDICGTKTN